MNQVIYFAPLRASFLIAVFCCGGASSALGGIIFSDDFESYANTAALNAVWPVGVGNDTQSFLDSGPAGSTNTSFTVHTVNRQGRRDRTFPPTLPTATDPIIVQYDFYDVGGDVGANDYIQLLAFDSSNALSQLIAIGKSNLATTNGPINTAKYQGRIAFPPAASGGVNWINLNANRSVGWHTFAAEIFPTTVNFYVDGVLDTANLPRAAAGDSFSVARIGAGLGSRAEVAYYDNFFVSLGAPIPEPSGVALALAGAAFLAVRAKGRGARLRK